MASKKHSSEPRNFYLNEFHELTPSHKTGGGRPARYSGLSWQQKANNISSSISLAVELIEKSRGPLKKERNFLLAKPEPTVIKLSDDKKRHLTVLLQSQPPSVECTVQCLID